MITIRLADKADASLIASMSRQTFYETFAARNTAANMEKFMAEQFGHAKLMNEVGAPGNIFLLAFDADTVVGYARLKEGERLPELKDKAAIEIARIYASTSSIGKGVGSSLMQKCIDIAIEMNKQVIWLGVWEENTRAISFYEKWGFEKFGTHIFLLGDDPQTDWLMKKEL